MSTMLALVVAAAFARMRWVTLFHDGMPQAFPYPDRYLLVIHDWWDRTHPPAAGTMKLHGEYDFVLQLTNATLMVALLLFFAVAGYAFRHFHFDRGRHDSKWIPDRPRDRHHFQK
ncbi:MAG: hypothetical protein AAFU85_27090 [Planctomycetota bacterium]